VAVVQTTDLRKSYGMIDALRGVTMSVEPGQIFGLLGQNGAGKSTMVKILLGIVRKTAGEAFLLGYPAGTTEIRTKVGYLPEDHQFPAYHTAFTLMDFYGQLYGMPREDRRKRIFEALDIVGLRKRMDTKVKTYSKGMKQRLGIAQSFFHDPDVIFLDEPTDGVDPVGRKEIRDLLITLKGEGRTIFVNSHLLGEVEMISDRVAIMHQGQLVRQGTVEDLTRRANRYSFGLAPGQVFPVKDVEQLGFKVEKVDDYYEVEMPPGQSADVIQDLLQSKELKLRHFAEVKETLENVFMKLVEGANTDGKRAVRVARPVARRGGDN